MLKCAQARHSVETAEALAAYLARILKVDLKAVLAAGPQLRRGQGDPHPSPTPRTNVVQ
jgi:hypothetical protein